MRTHSNNIDPALGEAQTWRCLALMTFFVLGPAGVSAQSQQEAAFQGPSMRILEREIDLGEVLRGSVHEVRFKIGNVGTETLRILSAQPG